MKAEQEFTRSKEGVVFLAKGMVCRKSPEAGKSLVILEELKAGLKDRGKNVGKSRRVDGGRLDYL